MDSNFSTLSLEKIQEKLSHIDSDSFEILEWDQSSQWRNQIQTLGQIEQKCLPRYLFIPNTKDMLSQLLSICYRENWRVFPLGSGSKISWGKINDGCDIFVSTCNLDKILEHAIDDLVITVESGVKISDLQEFLVAQGQFLPIAPCYPETTTVGGVVATADSGSWRQCYGGVRDLVLGISFLRADGEEVKAGGKVVKNVAGYDLMKLFTGSYGNLGIISTVTFRLFPIPADSSTICLWGDRNSIKMLRTAIVSSGLTPTMAELLSPSLADSLNLASDLALAIRFQSIQASVEEQLQQIQTWSQELSLSSRIYQQEEETSLWTNINQQVSSNNQENSIFCKVGILPSQAVDFLAQCQGDCQLNISTGVGYGLWVNQTTSSKMKELRKFCEQHSGYLTILRGSTQIKKEIEPWGYVGNGLGMMRKIKQNFDPTGVFVDRL